MAQHPFRVSEKQKKLSYKLRLDAFSNKPGAKTRLANYKKRIKELRVEAQKEQWIMDGIIMNRDKMMTYICSRVAGGESLPEVCDNQQMPTMLQVYSWFDNFPSFQKDYYRAEEVRGHILGEEAVKTAKSTDRENVAADKLKTDVLLRAAARANNRFQEKQVIEQKDEYSTMTAEQIKARVRALLAADPDLMLSLSDRLPELGISAQQPEPSLPTLDCDPIDTLSSDES